MVTQQLTGFLYFKLSWGNIAGEMASFMWLSSTLKKHLIALIDPFCFYLVYLGLPRPFIKLLISMYEITLSVVIITKQGVSRPFTACKRIRQGSTLSPKLFTLYINDLAGH